MSVHALSSTGGATKEEDEWYNKRRGTPVKHKKNLKVGGAFAFRGK